MRIRSSSESFEVVPSAANAALRKIADRPGEIRRVVSRLMALVVPHLDAAKAINLLLGADDLRAAISALEAEADGLDPRSRLAGPDEVRTYLRQSLYEELLAEPSNVFYTSKINPEVVRYEAMTRDFWKECLAGLSKKLGLKGKENS